MTKPGFVALLVALVSLLLIGTTRVVAGEAGGGRAIPRAIGPSIPNSTLKLWAAQERVSRKHLLGPAP
jgi:hypothetical protein